MKTVLSPTLRIAIGLMGLCISLFILADFAFGLLPDREGQARTLRTRLSESTTALVAEALRAQELPRVAQALDVVRSRNADMISAAVRDAGGRLVASTGAHAADWAGEASNASTSTRVIVPIHSAQGQWGRAEFAFAPPVPTHAMAWLKDSFVWVAIGLPLAALAAMYLYLRRALVHMNPMAVVPDRLRAAFDGLTEGVALLDTRGRVVLANTALREMAAAQADKMHGRELADAAQLKLAQPAATLPWEDVLRTAQVVRGVAVHIGAGEQRRSGVMNCSPITDPQGNVRGCLATVGDVTQIERSNGELRAAMAELERSRAQIEAQNQELIKLATRDSLTGLLNRRAFFDTARNIVARNAKSGGYVAVLMLDVDHFKSVNDKYGHAVGDHVLQGVARQLTESLREQDLVARYGGEEFCVLIEGMNELDAYGRAERVRRTIQFQAGRKLLDGRDLVVTVSIGVCGCPPGPGDLNELLKRADAALYEAKRGGRNRVVLAGSQAASPARETIAA
jgi:diguanylate cyclase (GGDEF)-like protein/PAS domain S-box-containing protein